MRITILLVLTVPVLAAQAQKPRTPDEVPVFPGARYTGPAANASDSTIPLGAFNPNEPMFRLSSGSRAWTVGAAPEAVLTWYIDALNAKKFETELTTDPSPNARVWMSVDEYDVKRPGVGPVWSGAQVKRWLIGTARKPYAPDFWVRYASFAWGVRSADGSRTDFTVGLEDAHPVMDRPVTEVGTNVTLQWFTYLEGEQATQRIRAARLEKQRVATEARSAEMGATGPSEAELGAPLYPSATFARDLSAGMSSGNERYYIYFTRDDAPRVRKWFEDRIGKKALDAIGGGWYIPLDSNPIPQVTISIRSTADMPYKPMGATIITVNKKPR